MRNAEPADLKLEVVILPVSDAERAKRFYTGLGWRQDADFSFDNGLRVLQFTPPGSACSIQFGTNLSKAPPGSVQDIYLIVSDIEAAREDLAARGAAVSAVFHPTAPGAQFEPFAGSGRAEGPAPEHASYRSFATFKDPDGNGFLLQEIRTRFEGRGFTSDVASLTQLLREAEEHHGAYEATAPKHHWSDWYAAYIVARERGKSKGDAVEEAGLHMENLRR
jgi:catechol 2,3-dioxygenase-like lactoylglutathione lyase family enzyme